MIDFTSAYTVRNTIIIFASLSSLASLFIVACFIAYKPLRSTFAFRLVFYLTLSNIITMIGRFFVFPTSSSFENGSFFCTGQGFLINYGMLSSLFWVDIFSHALYIAIVKNDKHINKKHGIYLVIGFIIPLIFSVVPLIMGQYGTAGNWCWLKDIGQDDWTDNILA